MNDKTFPRDLRITVRVIVPDDRYTSLVVADAIRRLSEEPWFLAGSYASGKEHRVGDVTLKLTFRNWYGKNWYRRLRNWLWRGKRGWGWR